MTPSDSPSLGAPQPRSWGFLTNHGRVLLCLGIDPSSRLRELTDKIGITERAVHAIITDLEQNGFLHRVKVGRRVNYLLNEDAPMRHPIESNATVREFLSAFMSRPPDDAEHFGVRGA